MACGISVQKGWWHMGMADIDRHSGPQKLLDMPQGSPEDVKMLGLFMDVGAMMIRNGSEVPQALPPPARFPRTPGISALMPALSLQFVLSVPQWLVAVCNTLCSGHLSAPASRSPSLSHPWFLWSWSTPIHPACSWYIPEWM